MQPRLVVVSGLPASGKSTVGKLLSERLSMPLIDKDTILESLFDSLSCPDRAERHRLSRASDEVLYALAATAPAAILVNWWDPHTAPARLRAVSTPIVEVFCDCPVEVAAARFESRHRHRGHHDPKRSPQEVDQQIERMPVAFRGPLGVGTLVRVDTSRRLNDDEVVGYVQSALAANPTST